MQGRITQESFRCVGAPREDRRAGGVCAAEEQRERAAKGKGKGGEGEEWTRKGKEVDCRMEEERGGETEE